MSLTSALPSAGMPRSMVWLFATASGLSVANVYYAQPLLDALANDFGINHAAVGGVVTATQIGCALALLLVVPLGDKVDRRRLMAVQLIALVVALVSVSMAQSSSALLIGMLATGMLGTAMTQGLIAYAASAASPHEQGRVVGAAQGGVFTGLLLARVFAGGISDIAGWRGGRAGGWPGRTLGRSGICPTHQRGGAEYLTVSLVALVADGPFTRDLAYRHHTARLGRSGAARH